MATVLNTFRAQRKLIPNQEKFSYIRPSDEKKIEYHYYNQLNILDGNTESIKKKIEIAPSIAGQQATENSADFDPGLNLGNVRDILRYYHVFCETHICETSEKDDIDKFREDLRRVLSEEEELMILNFDGEVCGLSTGGHFSTVGAYDEGEDAILILDAAAHKNPWFWVPIKHIYYAMNTESDDGFRGYLIVRDEVE